MLSHVYGTESHHPEWIQLRDTQHLHAAMVQSFSGPGLSAMGIYELGYWPFLVPDFRCSRWHTSVGALCPLGEVFPLADNGNYRRRTHQSGPLGELFDHGVDALNTSLEALIFAASQNLGMGWKTVMTLFGGTTQTGQNIRACANVSRSPYLLRPNLG